MISTRINSMNGDSIVHVLFKISNRLAVIQVTTPQNRGSSSPSYVHWPNKLC
jgi:hypothetical protein